MEASSTGKLHPLKGSDSSEYKTQPKDTSSRDRSFSLVDFFKGRKSNKKDNSAEEKHSTLPPPLPPKTKTYIVNHVRYGIQEEIYREVSPMETIMNNEYITILENGLNQEETLPKEVAKKGPEEVKEEEETVDGLCKNITRHNETKNTHKRNISALSFGSFYFDTPVELVGELLSGEEWAPYMDNRKTFSTEKDSTSKDSNLTKLNKCNHQPNKAIQSEVVDGGNKSTETQKLPENEDKPMGSGIEDILKSLTIKKKTETPKIELKSDIPPPPLPSKVSFSPSSSSPQRAYRSSVFYKIHPEEQPLSDLHTVTSDTAMSTSEDSNLTKTDKCDKPNQEVHSDGVDRGEQRQLSGREVEPAETNIEEILKTLKIIETKIEAPKIEPGDDDDDDDDPPPHSLPPKISPLPSSSLQSVFRSSVFYKFPPEVEQKLPDPLKSGPKTVKKKNRTLKKSSTEETQLKDSDNSSCEREKDL